MSEKQITGTLLGIFVMLFQGVLAVAVLFAYLLYIMIGLGALLFLTIVGIAWRKWQHSRIPVNEDRREKLRLELEEFERRERLRIERERHEHELRLACILTNSKKLASEEATSKIGISGHSWHIRSVRRRV